MDNGRKRNEGGAMYHEIVGMNGRRVWAADEPEMRARYRNVGKGGDELLWLAT